MTHPAGRSRRTALPLIPREVDSPTKIETDSLGLEQHPLLQLGARETPSAHLATMIDDPMPRDPMPQWQGMEGIAYLARLAGASRYPGNLPVCRDTAGRDTSNLPVHPLIKRLLVWQRLSSVGSAVLGLLCRPLTQLIHDGPHLVDLPGREDFFESAVEPVARLG